MEHIGTVASRAIGARGRQDRSGQEKVIDIDKLKVEMQTLKKLQTEARESAKAFSDKVKTVADKSGLLASVVRKIVTARNGENFEEKKKEAEQLDLVFDKVA